LEVNDEWLGHILGALEVLDQQDTWVGTEDDILDVRRQVNEMMAAFMEECDPMSNCCPEPLTRVTEDGTLEVSYDDGATWQNATTEDPRNTAPQLPPLTGENGDAKKCTAANNVLGQFKDGISTFEGYYDTSATVVEFVTAVAGAICAFIFAPLAVPIVVAAIIALMSAVWNVGKTAYVAAFNDTVFGDLLCILFCHCQDDGTFTDEDFAAIRSDISAHFDSIASGAFLALLNGVTVTGLNTMARIPTGSSASCDSCDCADPTCDIDKWVVGAAIYLGAPNYTFPGVEVSRGSNYIIARSTDRGDGNFNIFISNMTDTLGCVQTVTKISGNDTNSHYYVPDGSPPVYIDNYIGDETGDFWGHCKTGIQIWTLTGEGVYRFEFAAC
jgi:hypothetical protein